MARWRLEVFAGWKKDSQAPHLKAGSFCCVSRALGLPKASQPGAPGGMHGKRVRAGSSPPSAADGPCCAPRPASSTPLLQTAPKCSPFQHTAPVCDPLSCTELPFASTELRLSGLWSLHLLRQLPGLSPRPCVVLKLFWQPPSSLLGPHPPSSLLWVLWFPWRGASPSLRLPSPDSGTHCVPASVLMPRVYLQHPRR